MEGNESGGKVRELPPVDARELEANARKVVTRGKPPGGWKPTRPKGTKQEG